MANFEALTFLLGLDLFAMHGHFSCVAAAPGSVLPSAISISSTSYPEDVSWPSSTCVFATSIVYVVAAASTTFFCSVAFCPASHTALTLATTFSFYLLLASWVMHSLASSLFFYATAFSSSTKSGVRHLRGHVSNIVKIALSVAKNVSFIHCFTRSFGTLK